MNGIDLDRLDSSPTGFVLVMIMMVCVAIGLLVFFVKKKWLWVRDKNDGESIHQQNVREHKNRPDNQNGHIRYHVL